MSETEFFNYKNKLSKQLEKESIFVVQGMSAIFFSNLLFNKGQTYKQHERKIGKDKVLDYIRDFMDVNCQDLNYSYIRKVVSIDNVRESDEVKIELAVGQIAFL